MDILVSIGETAQFSCNFTGEHRVHQEKVTWLKGNCFSMRKKKKRTYTFVFCALFPRW